MIFLKTFSLKTFLVEILLNAFQKPVIYINLLKTYFRKIIILFPLKNKFNEN